MGDDALGAWRQQSMTCTVLRSIGLIVCLVVSGRAGGFGGIGQFFPMWKYRSKLSNHAKFTLDRDGSGLLPSSDRLLLTYFAYCSASVRHSDGYSSSIVHVNLVSDVQKNRKERNVVSCVVLCSRRSYSYCRTTIGLCEIKFEC